MQCGKRCSGEIEPIAHWKTNRKFCDNSKRLCVAFEALNVEALSAPILFSQDFIQRLFSDVAEGRVAKVVPKTCGLYHLRIQAGSFRDLRFLL